MRATHARLEHAAAPERDPARVAELVDLQRGPKAPHATRLEVDHAAASQLERAPGRTGRGDRLVQTDRRLDLALEPRVVLESAGAEGLLDHRQTEQVELAQPRQVAERVRAVGVDA